MLKVARLVVYAGMLKANALIDMFEVDRMGFRRYCCVADVVAVVATVTRSLVAPVILVIVPPFDTVFILLVAMFRTDGMYDAVFWEMDVFVVVVGAITVSHSVVFAIAFRNHIFAFTAIMVCGL